MAGSASLAVLFGLILSGSLAAVPSQQAFYPHPGAAAEALVQGEIKQALAYYETLARTHEENARISGDAKDWKAAGEAYRAASTAARFHGQLQKSIDYGQKTLEIGQKIQDPFLQLAGHNKLIFVHRDLRELDKIKQSLDASFEIVRTLPPGSDLRLRWEAEIYMNLGEYYRYGPKEYDKALDAYGKSLVAREAYLARLDPSATEGYGLYEVRSARNQFLMTMIREGFTYRRMRDRDKEMEAYQKTLAKVEEWHFESHHSRIVWEGMAGIYLEQKKYEKALENFEKALAALEKRDRNAYASRARARVGTALVALGRPAEAIPYFKRSIEGIEDTRSLMVSDYRKSYFRGQLGVYVKMMGALAAVGNARSAFDYNERARSRYFLDLLGSKVALSKARSGLRDEEEALNAQVRSIKEKKAKDLSNLAIRNEVNTAQKAYKSLLAKVNSTDEEQASLMTVQASRLTDIQNLIDPGTTLIEYFVSDKEVFAWVVEKTTAKQYRLAVSQKQLKGLVTDLRANVTKLAGKGDVDKASAALYAAILGPLWQDITGKSLIIVPHDVLHYVPFQMLVSPAGRYLIEDYPIHYLTSASLLKFVVAKRRAKRGQRVLAFANADLGGSKPELRYAEEEVRQLQDSYPESTVFVKGEATEDRAKKLAEGYDILHFATHAELEEKDPLSSALLLAGKGDRALRLEVREIFEMNLNADLVVLSGCETGLGKLSRGDEITGLTRAFIYAGTPSVVASLWKVEDRSTALLMAHFYENLKTMSKAEALRQAQLALIKGDEETQLIAMRGVGGITKSGKVLEMTRASTEKAPTSTSHPYFWAPFVLVGDSR